MKELFDDIVKFQKETFPDSNAYSKAKHLEKEVAELLEDLTRDYGEDPKADSEATKMEYADCFILLFGSANAYGISYDDLEVIISQKMDINKKRKWGKPDKDGVVLHLKD